jgi:hypothetical protein
MQVNPHKIQCKVLSRDTGYYFLLLTKMANFTPSNLLKAQTMLTESFTEPEMREKILPSIQIGLKNKDVLVKGAEELRKREDRAVSGYAMMRQVRSTGSQRTATHTGARGDSMELPFTWNTFSDTFSISLKQMDNNLFSFEQAMMQNIKNCVLNIHSAIETANITYLLAARNQVVQTTNPVGGYVTWNATNHVHEIGTPYNNRFTQLAKSVMRSNKYNGNMFDAIFDNQMYTNAEFWASQGGQNAQNTAFQFTGMNINPSIELADSDYPDGIALVMQPATYAMIPWIPRQNITGYGDYNSFLGGYGSIIDPITNPNGIYSGGLVFAVHGYALRADTSSDNGVEQDNLMQFEISVDVANALTPLSVANESVVYAFGQM